MKVLIAASLLLCQTCWAFEPGRAAFAVRVNDFVVPYREFAVFALPGQPLEVSVADPGAEVYELESPAGLMNGTVWSLSAPDTPGLQAIQVRSTTGTVRLNVLVMHPADTVVDGRLRGYDIGPYPAPLHGNPAYTAPDGFVELNADTESVRLSPHFTLGQFPSKQSTEYPKYLVLREHLLLKLELLLERVNARGIAADSFVIMSGFRTPHYNRAIGNVPSSRHVYGGAADIFVDVAPPDGVMDDLNRDGTVDYRDAQFLYRVAEGLFAEPANRWLAGGQGVYRRNPAHGPFMHIDARGSRARWGLIPSALPAASARVSATVREGD